MAADSLSQGLFLIRCAELEELLDDVVAKHVGHQAVGGSQDFTEYHRFLGGCRSLQFLLDKPKRGGNKSVESQNCIMAINYKIMIRFTLPMLRLHSFQSIIIADRPINQGLSQDLETGCPKLAIVKILGVQIFKGDHNILRFQQ